MKKFIYVPLEVYSERYTSFLSAEDGVWETRLQKHKIPYVAVRGEPGKGYIDKGIVLDTEQRCRWALSQTIMLVEMMNSGEIQDGDAIYLEDFWHPGFSALPYAQHLYGLKNLKIYAFCHAQSVDPHDFTAAMAGWMRDFEIGESKCLNGIFVAAKELATMLTVGGVQGCPAYVSGPIYDADVVVSRAGLAWDYKKVSPSAIRNKTVIYSSRLDPEKNPMFFLQLAQAVIQEREDVNFVVCSGYKKIRSAAPAVVTAFRTFAEDNPGRFIIQEGLTKRQYYECLEHGKVQFNCASQDFVSYTLLEATTFGCLPLYPNYLTFPDALHHVPEYLYEKGNLDDAKKKLYALLDDTAPRDVSWVYKQYEGSVEKILTFMGFLS